MKILVFGAGALGSLVGGLLSAKNEVTLIGRKGQVERIRKKGLRITGIENVVVRIQAYEYIREAAGKNRSTPELIILTVKSHDTKEAGLQIHKIFPEEVPVLSLQNGLGNVETLSGIFGEKRVLCGLSSHGVMLERNGNVRHAGRGETVFGELDGKITERLKVISKLFKAAGIDNRFSDNIRGEIWAKAIVNAGINPLTAITGLENGYLLKIAELERTLETACREGIDTAVAAGVRLPDVDIIEKTKSVARLTAKNRSSMLQDIERGKKSEIDAINGAIARIGSECGVETPVNAVLTALVKAIEMKGRV